MICKQQDCFTDFTFPTVLLASLACEFSQSLSAWNKSGSKLQYYALLLLLLLLFGGEGGRGEWQQDSHSFCLFCFLNSTIPVKRMLILMKQMVVQSDNTSWKASQEQPSMVNRWMYDHYTIMCYGLHLPHQFSTVKFCADSTKVLWWDQINWGRLLLLLFIAFI